MSDELRWTVWTIEGVPGLPQKLNLILTVDTTSPQVIEAIEKAAAANGIELALETLPDETLGGAT